MSSTPMGYHDVVGFDIAVAHAFTVGEAHGITGPAQDPDPFAIFPNPRLLPRTADMGVAMSQGTARSVTDPVELVDQMTYIQGRGPVAQTVEELMGRHTEDVDIELIP